MPGDAEDSWLGVLGVDVGQIRAKVQGVVSDVENTVDKSIDTVVGGATQLYKDVATGVAQTVQNVENTGGALVSAVKKVAQSFTPGASSGPMQPDCKPVHGQVPGPPEHLLCQTHGHILDVNSGQIIAASLAEYKNLSSSGMLGKIINPLANAANGLIQDAKTGLDQATNLATDLGHQVVQDVSAVADTVAANLPDASSLVDDIGRSGPLNSPSYVNGSGGPSGDGNASAGDSEFVTGYKDDLLSRAARIKALAEKFYKVSEDLDSKGHHWLWSNDTDVLASAKTINDMAKALAILASEIDSWSNSPNKDAIKKGSDAAKYVGYLLNAADFVVAAKDMELSIDNLNASKGEATVNAWADSMGNLFDKAGGLIDLIPDGAVPGFMKDYWKGLFSAPKNYIAAFKTIMKEHYDIVNEEGHVNTGDGQQAYNLGMAQTEWRGALTGIYVGAFTLPKNTAGQTLQEFMRKHQDEDGLDLYKAPLQAGKETLCHRIEANLAGDDPALEAWLSYVRKN